MVGGISNHASLLCGPVWNPVPDMLFVHQAEAPSLYWWGFLIIAKMNLESMQALPESHFCSFEPQRHDGNASSGFSHFPQLLVLLGLPCSLGVLCTQDHFTTRSPLPATTLRLSSKSRSLLSRFRREVGSM